jgi:hypothetical protein
MHVGHAQIGVEKKNPLALPSQGDRQIHAHRGLSHATFAAGDSDDPQGPPLSGKLTANHRDRLSLAEKSVVDIHEQFQVGGGPEHILKFTLDELEAGRLDPGERVFGP